jgi:hypothetical protein
MASGLICKRVFSKHHIFMLFKQGSAIAAFTSAQ